MHNCFSEDFGPYLANFPRDWLILAGVLNSVGGVGRELDPPEIEGI